MRLVGFRFAALRSRKALYIHRHAFVLLNVRYELCSTMVGFRFNYPPRGAAGRAHSHRKSLEGYTGLPLAD